MGEGSRERRVEVGKLAESLGDNWHFSAEREDGVKKPMLEDKKAERK